MILGKLQNKYINQRCFIICSGPSLLQEDLSVLKNEKIFIVNQSYKAYSLGLSHHDFYVLTDLRVYVEHQKEIIEKSGYPRFYNSNIYNEIIYQNGPKEEFIPIIKKEENRNSFDKGIMPISYDLGWGKTRTVALDAALVAFFLGFNKIYLLGADFSFDPKSNTHFYDERKEFWIPQGISNTVNLLNHFFKMNNTLMVNLSRGYNNNLNFFTDKLINVI